MSTKALLLFLLGLVLAAEARILQNQLAADLASDLGSIDDRTITKQRSGKALLNRRKRDASSSSMESAEIEVEASEIAKFILSVGWNEDKLDILSGFISELSDSENNLTIVGWQNIFDDSGAVKQINAIQFVIPPKPETAEAIKTDDDDEEEDIDEDFGRLIPHTLVKRLREIFEPMEELGIPASTIFEEYNKAGEPEVQIYLDKTTLWANTEGFEVYNKTIVGVSADEVEAFAELVENDPKIMIKGGFTHGPDGKLGKDYYPAPYFLGSVLEEYEATDDILLESPEIMADTWVEHPRGEVSKELVKAFNKKWPEYQWRVIIDPTYFYVSRDISVTLSVDNLDFDETSDISYMVYGRKTKSPSQ